MTATPGSGAAEPADGAGAAADGTATPAGDVARGRRRSRLLIPTLALLTALGTGASVWLAVDGPGANPPVDTVASAREAAVAAATQAVTNLTTYDHRTVRADFDRVAALATGRFASDFRAGSADLQRLIRTGKASSKGTVVAAGAQSATESRAVVLLAVDNTVRNAKVPDGAVRRYRFSVTVDLVDGRWLVSELHPVT